MPKILVIADDFTGAAEIGGIAHLFGLSVRIMKDVYIPSPAGEEVIIIDTNSRRLQPLAASSKVQKSILEVDFTHLDLIFKKVDSVLRGPVESEIKAMMLATNIQTSLLIPANPSKGRTIQNGRYFIDDAPIHQTDFIHDPEYPRSSNDVRDLIIDHTESLLTERPFDLNRDHSIIVPDMIELKNFRNILKEWSEIEFLPAGGADFFRSLLKYKLDLVESRGYSYTPQIGKKYFIIGSKSQQSHRTISFLRQSGWIYLPIPENTFTQRDLSSQWLNQIQNALVDDAGILISRPDKQIDDPKDIKKIVDLLVKASELLLEYCSSEDEIFIEGGETASSIIRNLKDTDLKIKEVIADGVVKLRLFSSGIFINVKPGSYPWSEIILDFIKADQ
jgi:uncharacterized protein YgbK (DUF1537 family)